jgi:hypothetical protein
MKAKMAMEGRKRRGGGKERCARGTVQLGRRSYPDSEGQRWRDQRSSLQRGTPYRT